MKTDDQIQMDVMEELRWQPYLKASEIGVAVKDGIVTLSGRVDSYSKKLAAEKAAKKIAGVRAIAEDIQIGISPETGKSDTEIAEAALNALKWNAMVPADKIKLKVEDAIVKLEGEVEWEYQRQQAKKAIQHLTGIRFIINSITVTPKVKLSDIEHKISAAFHRSATIDAEKVKAEIDNNKVILRGKVRSFAEKEDAENAAWAAPGILEVENDLQIEEKQFAF